MLKATLAASAATAALALTAGTAQAATFTVVNANDTGPGSLRSALNSAESTGTADVIKFEIPGPGPHVITPSFPLPTLTNPVKIRGYSEPGATPATATSSAVIKIAIDAVNVARGLDIGGDEIEVRGLNIRRAQAAGIYVEGSDNVIAGNHIGTNAPGTVARPNGDYGVHVFAENNMIGGPDAKDRNVIASNGLAEVLVEGGSHVIEGNRIGSTADGRSALGALVGVRLESDGNVVRDNLIVGENNGVQVEADDNVLAGNLIGNDGATAIPNFIGANVIGGDDNVIGAGNVISGNEAAGLQLTNIAGDPALGNRVLDNLIGTNATGDKPVPNGTANALAGVVVFDSAKNRLEGNVIAGNLGDGVHLDGADRNVLNGNWIGTDRTATLDLGNSESGVDVEGSENRISDGTSNTIMFNHHDGVTVTSGTGNAILANSIAQNDQLGIDLGADGPTPNDNLDGDAGPNDLQNGPEIVSASAASVDWTLHSVPLTQFRLDFYANDACDPSGSGEAQTHLGSTVVTTNANGNVSGSTPVAAGLGVAVAMTATRLQPLPLGLPPAPRSTSELSPCELSA